MPDRSTTVDKLPGLDPVPGRRCASIARRAVIAGLAFLALGTAGAPAQDRRLDAHVGGPVALQSRPFAWTADEARAFLDGRTGERVVLVLAGADAADPLAASALPARRFELDSSRARIGDEVEPARAVANAAAVELVGGSWVAWWRVLTPSDKTSRLGVELLEAHRRGTPVLGAGAAASFLASSSPVARAELARPERNGHRPDPDTAFGGLGLVRTVFDADALASDSLERGLRALLRGGATESLHLAGDAAWIVDERAERARLLGRDGAFALVVDVSRARRMREAVREGRLTRLEPGAEWDLARGTTVPERERWTAPLGDAPRVPTTAVTDPLATVIAGAALARGSALREARWTSARCTFELACDEATLGGGAEPFARVRFDVAWEFPEPVR